MWWIIAIPLVLILMQVFLLGHHDKPIHPDKKAIIMLLSFALWFFTLTVTATNSLFITATINDYHKGSIIKVETITIQDTDTVKVIKYKYK